MEKFLNNFKKIIGGEKVKGILPPLMAIIAGLLVGFVTLILFNPSESLSGFSTLLTGGFSSQKAFAKTLSTAAPLILTGLSVGIAYKCGLFNIGAAGQFLFGGFAALLAGLVWGWPWYACLLVAAVAGLIIGSIPGILKAYLNVNEVITTIMLNWITLYLVIVLVGNFRTMWASDVALKGETAKLKDVNVSGILPDWGLVDLMSEKSMSIAIIIAIIIAVVLYVIIKKTTFGFKLTACGFNKHASQYAGINSKKYIVYVMLIAGALSGIGGGLFYLQGRVILNYGTASLPSQGFDGIAVALLGANNPIGIIFSAFFISYLKVGGSKMQPEFLSENIDMIISIILYF
ncbi:MAG: ABC transporter permease, partial [Proteobacteria bacterium]|nr:ABC transporter permease [Pseudomonadota bacterium]